MSKDRVSAIIALENGDLPEEEIVELFQSMIDDGTVWKLQGYYGRMADYLIKEGVCHANHEVKPEAGRE